MARGGHRSDQTLAERLEDEPYDDEGYGEDNGFEDFINRHSLRVDY